MNFLFKDIDLFNWKEFSFTLAFPKHEWMYKKVSKNEFWFVNKNNNQALILNYFNEKYHTNELLQLEFGSLAQVIKIGDFEAFITCKNFKLHATLQYEWTFVDSGLKFIFSYPILEEKSEVEKDKDYDEAFNILNTLKSKKMIE